MQYHTTKELYVVVYHVPDGLVATRLPMVLVDGLVAFDAYEILCGGQCAVHVGRCDLHFFAFGEALGGLLHDGKCLGQYLVEGYLILIKYGGLQFVYLVEELFAVFNLGSLYFGFQFGNLDILCYCRLLDAILQLLCLGTELIVAQLLDAGVGDFHLLYPGLYLTHVACVLVAEQLSYKFIKSHIYLFCFIFLLYLKTRY